MKNIKISIFGGISKFSKLIVYGLRRVWQILVVLGNFGQIWAGSIALPIANRIPLDGLKTLKANNATTPCSGSLESYDPYLLLQKVSKYPHAFAIHCNMPKTKNAIHIEH